MVARCTYISQRRKGPSLILLGGRVFVGYNDTSKAYRIYFPGFKKIDISRDVNFDEDSTYFKSRSNPNQEVEEPEEMRV